MDSDVTKIKEDAIKISEQNIRDFLDTISKQSYISAGYITSVWFLLGFVDIQESNNNIFILGFMIILVSTYNILAKRVTLHTDMSPIFEDISWKTYEKYLNSKFKILRKHYHGVKNLACIKTTINTVLFVFLVWFLTLIYNTI